MEDTEYPACAHCGRPVTGRGPRPGSGVHYCTRGQCRAARDRAAYARRRAADDGPRETRPCTLCGAELPSRARRVTDSVLGRWCPKKSCQAAKRRQLSPAGILQAQEWYKLVKEQDVRFDAAKVEPCVCGCPAGRIGFMHRDFREVSITGWCTAQGEEKRMPMPDGYEDAFGENGVLA